MTHSYWYETSASRGNYSHMVMVREGELLTERCSPEKREEMATTEAATMAAALSPSFFLGDGATKEEHLPSLKAAWEEEFSWCPLT